MHRYFEAHRSMLDRALSAAAQRTYWSAAPEAPSGEIYGETAQAAFKAQVGKPFEMDHSDSRRLGNEESPWGFPLGVTYPSASIDEFVAASLAAGVDLSCNLTAAYSSTRVPHSAAIMSAAPIRRAMRA